jgi:hypothetical protein
MRPRAIAEDLGEFGDRSVPERERRLSQEKNISFSI